MTGWERLSHSGAAAHEAVERAEESLRQGWPLLRSWDGLPPEVMELLVAQARLSAVLAKSAEVLMRQSGSPMTAVDLLEAVRGEQLPRDERVDA